MRLVKGRTSCSALIYTPSHDITPEKVAKIACFEGCPKQPILRQNCRYEFQGYDRRANIIIFNIHFSKNKRESLYLRDTPGPKNPGFWAFWPKLPSNAPKWNTFAIYFHKKLKKFSPPTRKNYFIMSKTSRKLSKTSIRTPTNQEKLTKPIEN